jgi:hypothetical protein
VEVNSSQAAEKELLDRLSMNGKSSTPSSLVPFTLSLSKDEQGFTAS